jgi:hypothetical protein
MVAQEIDWMRVCEAQSTAEQYQDWVKENPTYEQLVDGVKGIKIGVG